ncbi:GNAT family N-acetyltransferase [Vibrio alginolyticus]|uniref:GNAT family N-acetyltransferase n=1 Tax=Vibrio alginolyticus TaxID=663 RepID=UPI001C9CBB6D|nr:GNAT family N-acetyltransferase [Vibrio alginolyticus]MBY7695482.1 GNAT family N-acetyltransferase [Vibrio alginolyticus]
MQIRSIKVSDIARFTALWNRVYSEGEFLISPAPDNATLRRILQRVENESIPQFVAFDRQKLIGSVEIYPAEMCGYERGQRLRVGILGIHIDKNYRGKGLGRKLLAVAIARGWEFGYDQIALYVYTTNTPAIALYERFGFEHQGELGEVTLPNGKVLMSQKMVLYKAQSRSKKTDL